MNKNYILTHSNMSTARQCMRKFFYRQELKRVVNSEAKALSFGRCMHKALETRLKSGLKAMVEDLVNISADMHETDAAKLTAMLEHYEPPKLEIIEVEHEFLSPIVNPKTGRRMRGYSCGGKIDAIGLDETGKKWNVEHKSSSQDIHGFGSYWQRLSIDHQVSIYAIETGANGCLYDVLRKPGLKLRIKDTIDMYQQRMSDVIKEDKEKYYQIRAIQKTKKDIETAKQELWEHAHIIAMCRKKGYYPRNSDACRSLYGTCEYLDVCTGMARIDDDVLFRDKDGENEELSFK